MMAKLSEARRRIEGVHERQNNFVVMSRQLESFAKEIIDDKNFLSAEWCAR
jgi:hypothetical protein